MAYRDAYFEVKFINLFEEGNIPIVTFIMCIDFKTVHAKSMLSLVVLGVWYWA